MNVCVINEVMNQNDSRWTRPFLTKVVVIVVILLISLQYLVNVAVMRRKESVIFLKLLDSSVQKILNQSGFVVQGSMREMVTKMEKPKELCPVIPPKLKGHVNVNMQVAAWANIEQENTVLAPGGRYRPTTCQARHRVAVIIPYRDRDIHLKIFLRNIHPFLQRQQLDYGIFVVELSADVKFNRALLMNVGFVEALKQHDYQCFIFHDVDLLPEDDRNLYTCPQVPRHMSVAIDRLHYKLPYAQIFGGVCAITTEHFKKINGFSNIFFGWGGEDDDMYRRILYSNLTVIRYSPEVARYKMLVHAKDPSNNNDRHMLLKTVKARRLTDGLSSLVYKVEKLEVRPLYTWILVSVNETEIMENEPVHKIAFKNLKRHVPVQKKAPVKKDKPKEDNKSNKSPQAVNVPKVAESKLNTQPQSPGVQEKKTDKNMPLVPTLTKNRSVKSPLQAPKVTGNKPMQSAPKVAANKSVRKPLQAPKEAENKLVKNPLLAPNVVENKSDKNHQQAANVGKQAEQNHKANNAINANQNSQNTHKNDPVKGVAKKQAVKEKTANIPKKSENGMRANPLVIRIKNPKQVSWIPTEFKGIIPTNLTKFRPLPIIIPEHMRKKKPVKVIKSVKKVVQTKQVISRDKIKKDGMNPIGEKSNTNVQPRNARSVNKNNRNEVEVKLGQQVLSKRQKR